MSGCTENAYGRAVIQHVKLILRVSLERSHFWNKVCNRNHSQLIAGTGLAGSLQMLSAGLPRHAAALTYSCDT
jgi:hypothetical protein